MDPSGHNTVAFGISGGFVYGVGAGMSVGLAFDDKGNVAIQITPVIHGIKEGFYVGVPGVNANLYLAQTELETIEDLQGSSTYIGGSLGSGITVGGDVILNGSVEDNINPKDEISNPNDRIIGKQLTVGFDATPEVHMMSSKSYNLFSFNVYDAKEKAVSWIKSVIF